MPEPLSIVTTALSITGSAYKTCKEIHDLINGIKNAPHHIGRLRSETEAIYSALATLQRILDSEAMKNAEDPDGLRMIIVEGMTEVLKQCLQVFMDVQKILVPFVQSKNTRGVWTGFKWESFKKDEVLQLSNALNGYKMTLTFSYQSLIFTTVRSTKESVDTIQRNIRNVEVQLDKQERDRMMERFENGGLEDLSLDGPSDLQTPSSFEDENSYSLPLKRFLNRTASLISVDRGSSVPSMVISEPIDEADTESSTSIETENLVENQMSGSSSALPTSDSAAESNFPKDNNHKAAMKRNLASDPEKVSDNTLESAIAARTATSAETPSLKTHYEGSSIPEFVESSIRLDDASSDTPQRPLASGNPSSLETISLGGPPNPVLLSNESRPANISPEIPPPPGHIAGNLRSAHHNLASDSVQLHRIALPDAHSPTQDFPAAVRCLKIIEELLTSQIVFERDMKVLQDIYCNTAYPSLSKSDITILFSNSADLLEFTESFTKKLKRAACGQSSASLPMIGEILLARDAPIPIGAVFKLALPELIKLFSLYNSNLPRAQKYLHSTMQGKNSSAVVWAQMCAETCFDLTTTPQLEELLKIPAIQIGRYSGLLNALENATPESHNDHTDLNEACRALISPSVHAAHTLGGLHSRKPSGKNWFNKLVTTKTTAPNPPVIDRSQKGAISPSTSANTTETTSTFPRSPTLVSDSSATEVTQDTLRSNVGSEILFSAASVYEFSIDSRRREAGFPYLKYVAGEIFDVFGKRGELWLAKNQDDPQNMLGWIWCKHFAKLRN